MEKIDNIEPPDVKLGRAVLKRVKSKTKHDYKKHRVRYGKTIFLFSTKKRMYERLKELGINLLDCQYAPPGVPLPEKKTIL